MKRELSPNEIIFDLKIQCQSNDEEVKEIKDAYRKIGRALSIENEGYNLYLVDSFSKDKINKLVEFINEQYSELPPPKDICYVTLKDSKRPKAIFVENGKGNKLKDVVEQIKSYYIEIVSEFYNSSSDDEKEKVIDEMNEIRTEFISELMDMAKADGFDVKDTTKGFAFIPLKGEEAMTEREYDSLEKEAQDMIVTKASNLKKKAEIVLEKLKDIEIKSLKKLKRLYKNFLAIQMEEHKDDALLEFITDDESYEYLETLFIDIEKEIISNYTMSIEEDETGILEVMEKYGVKVLVDNSKNSHPIAVYEEDPNINNLMGMVEYENHNGVYTTNLSLINSGSLLKANEGCLIVRVTSIANNPYSYQYLKKTLLTNKVVYDMSKSYLEFISINGLKPEPVPIRLKVILIGDYQTYDLLYSADEEFKKLFPLRAEFTRYVDVVDGEVNCIQKYITNRCTSNNILEVNEDGIREVFKYLCRKSGSRNKIDIDDFEIDKLLILANINAKESGNKLITSKDIIEVAYEKEKVEEEYIKMYKENKILVTVTGNRVGAINGLAVIDTGYHSFGKPMRITCIAHKGTGEIIDIHKESKLSGKIHEKSINILGGILRNIVNPYEQLPVDFHLSFEQIYGMIEGDSASVAEMICILSALTKKPIRQNIAVTGSLNQFGEVQIIGGVSEKIEGFYNVCNLVESTNGKGVLIPYSNKDDLILKPEVEDSILLGNFKIYTMEQLDDAIEILLLNKGETLEDFYKLINKEIEKYKS